MNDAGPDQDSGRAAPRRRTRSGGRFAAASFGLLLLAACAKPPPPPPPPAPDPAVLLREGEAVFQKTCAICHMADGGGVPYLQPAIDSSAWIANPDPQLLLSLILRGSAVLGDAAQAYENDMAPQEHLTDAELAAVATYVRHRFAPPPAPRPVTPEDVALARRRPGLP